MALISLVSFFLFHLYSELKDREVRKKLLEEIHQMTKEIHTHDILFGEQNK
jgi:hypothetical protein